MIGLEGQMAEEREPRKITQEELDAILVEHEKWLDSDGKKGAQADLRYTELSHKALPGAFEAHKRLTKANLSRAHMEGADLSGVHMEGADLRGAQMVGGAYLSFAHMEGANLSFASMVGAALCSAHMQGVVLFGAHLERADLSGAHMEGADLSYAHMKKVVLIEAHMDGTNLVGADLRNTDLTGVHYDRKITCRGVRLDGCYRSPRFERFLRDQDYLEELQESSWWGRFIYSLWKVFADCGRSIWPWALWSLIFVCWFGLQYFFLGPAHFKSDPIPWDWETAGYYSVITFTTLGFGDVVPKSHWAARLVMTEVITGYVMLGGLISIFANKLARRS